MKGNFSMIVHGWRQSARVAWVNSTIQQLLKHRGGCIFAMDYSYYAKTGNFARLVSNFEMISNVLLRKFIQIGNFDRQYCFGHSFGSRLCIDAGVSVGNQSIARMDVCDPAG